VQSSLSNTFHSILASSLDFRKLHHTPSKQPPATTFTTNINKSINVVELLKRAVPSEATSSQASAPTNYEGWSTAVEGGGNFPREGMLTSPPDAVASPSPSLCAWFKMARIDLTDVAFMSRDNIKYQPSDGRMAVELPGYSWGARLLPLLEGMATSP
jgi:hypothetical protein